MYIIHSLASLCICVLYYEQIVTRFVCIHAHMHTVYESISISSQSPLLGCTGFSVTVTLPVTPPMDPSQLAVHSTLVPAHAPPILEDYPITEQQYTVKFSDLTPGINYTYDIRIVHRTDTTTTVGLSIRGSRVIPG